MKKLLKFIITSMSFVFILMSIIQSSSTVKVEENNSSIPMNNPVDDHPLYAWEQEQPRPCRPDTDRGSF